MTQRIIVKVFCIPHVYELKDGGRDDIDEQAESQLDETKHFQFLIQGKTLQDIGYRLLQITQRKGGLL